MIDPRERRATPPTRDELQELRQVVSLLRGLPDPEPPPNLVANVMRQVEREQRSRRGPFRSGLPKFASAMAAGMAGLLVYTAIQDGKLPTPGLAPADPALVAAQRPEARPATRVPAAEVTRVAAVQTPRARQPRLGVSSGVTFFGAPPGIASDTAASGFGGLARAEAPDRSLDRQLNQLLMDPRAFFSRLEGMAASDHFVARLTDRSARRGDAAHVAFQLRTIPHPAAPRLSERFLHAALVESTGR